jgi:hypothetical protein
MLALRTDRLRSTPWAAPLDQILSPMPDYRLLIEGTGLAVADAFDTVVIATPDPASVSDTFLAARTSLDLRKSLKRVDWSTVPGGSIGKRLDPRVAQLQDPRVFAIPYPGWFLLTRPEYLPDLHAHPAWLDQLAHVEDQTGNPDGPMLILVIADVGTPTQTTVQLPGLPPLPIPSRVTLALTNDAKGIIITGAIVYPDAPTATTVATALSAARADWLGKMTARLLLANFGVAGAVKRLNLAQSETFITFSTSLTVEEAQTVLARAASFSAQYFGKRPAH